MQLKSLYMLHQERRIQAMARRRSWSMVRRRRRTWGVARRRSLMETVL